MEKKSYTKTRSPARVLSALLAAIMVLIVLPVLPVGAETITGVVFKNAKDGEAGQIVSFYDDSNLLSDLVTSQSSGGIWGKVRKISYSHLEWSGSDAKFTTSAPSGVGFYVDPAKDGNYALYAKRGESGVEKKIDLNTAGYYSILFSSLTGSEESTVYIYAKEVRAIQLVNPYGLAVTVDGNEYHETGTITVEATEDGVELTVNSGDASLEVTASINNEPTVATHLENNNYKVTVPVDKFSVGVPVVRIGTKTKQLQVTVSGYSENAYSLQGLKTDSSQTVPYGGTLTFTLYLKEGYDLPTVKYKGGGKGEDIEVTPGGSGNAYTYSILNITESITITFAGGRMKQFNITWNEKEGIYTFGGQSKSQKSVSYGTEITFTLDPDDDYSNSTFTVYANSTILYPEMDGQYKYTVVGDTTFSATGYTKNTYTISYPTSGTGYTIEPGATSVVAGTTVTFRVTLKDGYEVKNGKDLTSLFNTLDSGIATLSAGSVVNGSCTFTLSNIKKNVNLEVSQIEIDLIEYIVEDGQASSVEGGYDIAGLDGRVKWGNPATFTVTPQDGYRLVGVTATTDSGVPVTVNQSENAFSIPNVTANIMVYVDVDPITLQVLWESAGGKLDEYDFSGGTKDYTKTYAADMSVAAAAASTSIREIPFDEFPKYDSKTNRSSIKVEVPDRKGYLIDELTALSGGTCLIKDCGDNECWEISWPGNGDMDVTLRCDWVVDVTAGNEDNAFFKIIFQADHDSSNKENLKATISTNLSAEENGADYNSVVKVKEYGIVYGSEGAVSNIYDSCTISTFAGEQYQQYVFLNGGKSVLYVKMKGDDVEGELVKSGAVFTVRIGHSGSDSSSCAMSAFAWMILSINGEDYLFKSKVDACKSSE